MIEYRTERVSPYQEGDVTEILSAFGWQLVSSQEIYNENSEITGVDVKVYGDGIAGGFMKGFTGNDGKINVHQHRTVTNYVTLKFARNTDMPNYAKLKELDEEFERRLSVEEPKKPIKRTAATAIGLAIIIISIIYALSGNGAELWEILVCVGFGVIMIPFTVIGWVQYKRKRSYYEISTHQMSLIYQQAQELIS